MLERVKTTAMRQAFFAIVWVQASACARRRSPACAGESVHAVAL